jgi:hypothetical protein
MSIQLEYSRREEREAEQNDQAGDTGSDLSPSK